MILVILIDLYLMDPNTWANGENPNAQEASRK
jgi:hypothetical protein